MPFIQLNARQRRRPAEKRRRRQPKPRLHLRRPPPLSARRKNRRDSPRKSFLLLFLEKEGLAFLPTHPPKNLPTSPHPCSLYVPHHHGSPTLNAIPPNTEAAARMARHLGMCQELAELAMGLAKAAAEHAHRQFAAAATELPEPPTKPAPAAKTPDSVLTFARLSRVVRQSIALEARLAAPAHPARANHTRPPPDPRRAPVRAALAISLANHPDRTELIADTNELLEHTLAADPDRKLSLEAILITVADDFGITLDFAHMSNELLEVLSDHADPDPPEEGSGSF